MPWWTAWKCQTRLPVLASRADQAFGEEVVAGARAAVVVAGRRLDRQIHVAELFVRRHRRPDGDVAGVGPRIVQPGVVPELPRRRHGVERPQQLPGADVEAADVGGRRLHPRARGLVDDVHHAAGHAPDDDDVAHDGGRAAPAVPAEGRAAVALGEIDGAVGPEVGVALSGLRVQRDQEPAGDRDDPFVFAVGPIGQPPRRAAGVLLRRRIEPDDVAARRVERGDGPERRAHVQKAADLQRRVLIGARGLRRRAALSARAAAAQTDARRCEDPSPCPC